MFSAGGLRGALMTNNDSSSVYLRNFSPNRKRVGYISLPE